jgi:mono/diheme cytochrome c family protein
MSVSHRLIIGALTAGTLVLPAAWAAKPKPKPKPTPAPAKGDAKAGQQAFKSEGCTGCHKTKDFTTAGELGPDLSAVGKEKKPAEIQAYIQHPKSGSMMPAFKGSAKTLANMTAYLVTQK